MTFDLFDNQHATLVADPVDAAGNPSTCTNEAASVDNPALLTVAPNPGFPDQFQVRAQGKPGTATVTVTGTNEAGTQISTAFGFNIKATPAAGFTASLQGVANN